MDSKFCPGCMLTLPLTEEFFYRNRRKDRVKHGWQSYCKFCWPDINKNNKARLKIQRENFKQDYKAWYDGDIK